MPGIEVPESAVAKDSFVSKFNNNEFQSDDEYSGSNFVDGDEDSSDASSSDDDSYTQGSGRTSANRASNEVKDIARHETKAIRRWRLITLVVILLTGAFVALGSFLYLKNEEHKDATNSVSSK